MIRRKSVLGSLLITFGLIALTGTGVQAQIIIIPSPPSATGTGSLEPPGTAVDGSGDPVATTQTQPSWNQALPAAERFVRVLPTPFRPAGEAVLDKETGLVWEQSPLSTPHLWTQARYQCPGRSVGGKKGWRLPSVHELASLVDPWNAGGNPDLPAGHPFSNVQSHDYWSATEDIERSLYAWSVNFNDGVVDTSAKVDFSITVFVWCVRGGGPLSEY